MTKIRQYSLIALIYNPNSTGNAQELARQAARWLRRDVGPNTKVQLTPTSHAGHAEELAYDFSRRYTRPLIIAVSGDGGYHEVINGVMKAIDENSAKGRPSVSVLPAGNANDHHRVLHKESLEHVIHNADPSPIDLLRMTVRSVGSSKTITRYAHAYIGVGISPRVAHELNRHKLNFFREIKILFQVFFRFRPTKIFVDGTTVAIDSLVFTNIPEMAKILRLSNVTDIHDGKFEVVTLRHRSSARLIIMLLRAALRGLGEQPQAKRYEFGITNKTPIQVDGELLHCSQGDVIVIEAVKSAINTLR